jgi:hypothetical protein
MASIKTTCRGCKMGIADLSFHVHYGGCEYDPQARYNFKNLNRGMDMSPPDLSPCDSPDLSPCDSPDLSPRASPDLSPRASPDLSPRIPCYMCVMGIHGGCQK